MSIQDNDTRHRILQSARQLFSQKGYEGTSIRDIATLAEVNKSLVHYHFKSKSDILSEISRGFMDDALAEMGDFKDFADPAHPESLVIFLKKRMQYLMDNNDLLNILIIEALKSDPEHHFIFDLIRSLVDTILGRNAALKVKDYNQFITRFFFFTLVPMLIFSVMGRKMADNLHVDFSDMEMEFNGTMIQSFIHRAMDNQESGVL